MDGVIRDGGGIWSECTIASHELTDNNAAVDASVLIGISADVVPSGKLFKLDVRQFPVVDDLIAMRLGSCFDCGKIRRESRDFSLEKIGVAILLARVRCAPRRSSAAHAKARNFRL